MVSKMIAKGKYRVDGSPCSLRFNQFAAVVGPFQFQCTTIISLRQLCVCVIPFTSSKTDDKPLISFYLPRQLREKKRHTYLYLAKVVEECDVRWHTQSKMIKLKSIPCNFRWSFVILLPEHYLCLFVCACECARVAKEMARQKKYFVDRQ